MVDKLLVCVLNYVVVEKQVITNSAKKKFLQILPIHIFSLVSRIFYKIRVFCCPVRENTGQSVPY